MSVARGGAPVDQVTFGQADKRGADWRYNGYGFYIRRILVWVYKAQSFLALGNVIADLDPTVHGDNVGRQKLLRHNSCPRDFAQ
jgi:hypothetical protein